MSQQTTIRKLAELVNTPVEKLLEQLSEAGMAFSGPDQVVTSTEKVKLLGFLRRTHGKADAPAADAAAPSKITLNRRKVQEVTVASGRTKSTVAVEVRQKRTYVKPDEREVVDSSPAAQAAIAGADPERAEILRKLEESRQRNLTEQQRLAETDAKRKAELAERKRLEDEAAERERETAAAAAAAAAEAAVAEESAKPKAGHHGSHPKPVAPRVDDKAAAHKGKPNRGSHAMVTSIEDDDNAARFAGQLHLSASERARRTSSARGRPKSRRQLDQSRTGTGFMRPTAPVVREIVVGDALSLIHI